MSDSFNKLMIKSVADQESANELIGKLFDVTRPDAVYAEPVTVGEYTVINASEYMAGMGVGYGGGGGTAPSTDEASEESSDSTGFGGGGGGGGTTMARPVATIIVGPNGVRVEPVVDATKIAITMFTALGAMAMALRKMKK
ncbi:spore germination protein GerW family protein [Candidatus Leptofilum sp.]|uniref:spore germination protein GerW family protein n=1 Tax=Candidatus Leptofilum sp. TaxID=3241576 RepID=UPI003B5B875E